MKYIHLLIWSVVFSFCFVDDIAASDLTDVPERDITRGSQWEGKTVGILGDSMSDPKVRATSVRYYDYLQSLLGIKARQYARNGYKFGELLPLVERMYEEQGDSLDAIFVWCGTNDYNASKPIGTFYTETMRDVNVDGEIVRRKHRSYVMSDSTFCGSINMVLSDLKKKFPKQQIIIFTPIHRGFATFGENNVQPDENYANGEGLYIEDYASALHKAGELWSVPVIDFFSISGLFPNLENQEIYIANKVKDNLHPNEAGHLRLALTALYQLLTLPSSFKE
ncbi:MAG: SGNH/GDSL hydrolase family protein [Paramuribaculum sp.]|nr:SGNH/GDSL hydrolase family protein [Paramuribaculum sp.]